MALNPFAGLLKSREQRSIDAVDALAQALFYGGTVSASGVRVTPDTALASVAVAACVEVRAESFGALPGGVYQRDGRNRTPLTDHPVARLLFDRPNDLMTAGEFWRWKQIREDITGNAHVRIIWKNGRPAELWPLYGQKPEIRSDKGKIAYRYQGDALTPAGDYSSKDILHFKGPFLKNPLEADSPINLIRDTIGISIATEQFFGRFLQNGTHFPTYLETDAALKDEDLKAIANSLKATAGVLGAGTMRIFDRGLKVRQNQMSMRDADLTAQQRWYLEQICRIYRVPLPLVQDWTHGTYTNSEQAGLWFGQHTIVPIAVDSERAVRKLFIPGEEDIYIKFNVDGILRGDYTSRTQGYSTLINAGVISPNEARALEDLDPYEGGDTHLVPMNLAPTTTDTAATTDLVNRINALGSLVRAGFDPAQSATALGIDGIDYLNVQPVTVRTNEEIDANVEQTQAEADAIADPAARSALQPLIDDAIERIRVRAKQDHERGRTIEQTKAFAYRQVLPPIIEAANRLGIEVEVPWSTILDDLS